MRKRKEMLERRKEEDPKDLEKSGMHQLALVPIFVSVLSPTAFTFRLGCGAISGELIRGAQELCCC